MHLVPAQNLFSFPAAEWKLGRLAFWEQAGCGHPPFCCLPVSNTHICLTLFEVLCCAVLTHLADLCSATILKVVNPKFHIKIPSEYAAQGADVM